MKSLFPFAHAQEPTASCLRGASLLLMSVEQRFDKAIEIARTLPPTLLSKDQKLKLFALFKQADGPAPLQPPVNASEIEMAKVLQISRVSKLPSSVS